MSEGTDNQAVSSDVGGRQETGVAPKGLANIPIGGTSDVFKAIQRSLAENAEKEASEAPAVERDAAQEDVDNVAEGDASQIAQDTSQGEEGTEEHGEETPEKSDGEKPDDRAQLEASLSEAARRINDAAAREKELISRLEAAEKKAASIALLKKNPKKFFESEGLDYQEFVSKWVQPDADQEEVVDSPGGKIGELEQKLNQALEYIDSLQRQQTVYPAVEQTTRRLVSAHRDKFPHLRSEKILDQVIKQFQTVATGQESEADYIAGLQAMDRQIAAQKELFADLFETKNEKTAKTAGEKTPQGTAKQKGSQTSHSTATGVEASRVEGKEQSYEEYRRKFIRSMAR